MSYTTAVLAARYSLLAVLLAAASTACVTLSITIIATFTKVKLKI